MPIAELPTDERPKSVSSNSSSSLARAIDSQASIDSASSLASNDDYPIINEYEIHLPELPRYEPIVIPKEPSLEDLLRQVTGTDQLITVQEVKLRVISHMISLQRIHFFMPHLVKLNLDGSIVNSLRDLGCYMTCLKHLNVSRCGLRSLDGTSGLSALEELIAENNAIELIEPCIYLPELKKLNLKGNQVAILESLEFLSLCPLLSDLNLSENSVANYENYREFVKKNIPQLIILDDMTFNDRVPRQCTELSSSDYSSSLTSPEESLTVPGALALGAEANTIYMKIDLNEEPCKLVESRIRPATADHTPSIKILTSGQPVCGNIISTVRQRRQKNAWAESSSSSSASSSNCASGRATPKIIKSFPDQLPQKPVDLELGVIGVTTPNILQEASDTKTLLEAARKWRQNYQKSRASIKQADNLRMEKDFLSD